MSMLDRYRKPGGFVQLLALIETCNQAKQEKLLEIISQEDRRWSDTVRAKMLSIDRIYSWSDNALAEVFGSLQDLTVAVALHAATPEFKSRVIGFFTHGRVRKLEDILASKGPTPSEIAATHMKIVETVRKMGSDGSIRFDAIDPNLMIGDDIDDQLSHPPADSSTSIRPLNSTVADLQGSGRSETTEGFAGTSSHQAPTAPEVSESRVMELQTLKKRVADLSKENAVLRHELSMAKSKLDQIKKIA